jgi:acyl-CoA thioesterase-1
MIKKLMLAWIWCLILPISSTTYASTILVFGDSLSAGHGLEPGEEWPTLLQKQLNELYPGKYTVINASISGETTAGGLARFQPAIEKHQPDIVILELGANDGLRGQSLATLRENLSAMIKQSLQIKAQVLLIAMQIPPNYGKRYTSDFKNAYPELQLKHNIALSDFLFSGFEGRPEFLQKDGIHPTATAQPTILKTVWKSLKPLLPTSQ